MKSMARGALIAVVLFLVELSSAGAQPGYPTRPVRIVVPFAPGGVVDVMARILSQKLSDAFGQNFYIDNVGGAGGNIGTRVGAAAPKDGYTLIITSSSFVVNPSLHAKVPYDPVKDFTPITIAASSPNVLVVSPGEPSNTVAELIESIKKSPDRYSFASAGVGTTPHLSGELFKALTKVDIVHVPFASAGQALQSTAGGHTPITFSGLPPAVSLINSHAVKALAVTSAKRTSVLPDVPTMAEQGFAGQETDTLLFVLAPAGVPSDLVERLSGELRKILQTPDVQSRFDGLGFFALATSPEQSAQRIKAELSKWNKVITDANLKQTE
jgi:tripartite-type tricarboxylate transporter receptor subunit TctC